MGCDGGSIPTRRDLVKTSNKPTREHRSSTECWNTCALGREPLNIPIVSCSMGRLYNKEAIIRYLLERKQGKTNPIVEHIHSLKDITTLNLTLNPSISENDHIPLFICPVTRKEISKCRFVYLKPCGCVFSEQSINENIDHTCLLCNKPYQNIIVLNQSINR